MRAALETMPGVQDDRPTPPVPFPTATRKRRGGWIQTSSGRRFYPLDPLPSEVDLGDIASALSKMCRWGGHLPGDHVFSVAQHSVLVALSLPHDLRAQGLLHDAHEAYFVDIPSPIKSAIVNADLIAARLDAAIGDRFGIELCDLPHSVEEADMRSRATERRDLLVPCRWDHEDPKVKPWAAKIEPWSPADARKAFLGLAWKLGIK